MFTVGAFEHLSPPAKRLGHTLHQHLTKIPQGNFLGRKVAFSSWFGGFGSGSCGPVSLALGGPDGVCRGARKQRGKAELGLNTRATGENQL